MSDLADLIAIYRAIDQAVVRDGSGRSRAIAARYIPHYQDDAVPGWIHHLDRLFAPTGNQDDDPGQVGPPLRSALAHIAIDPPRGRMQSRFLVPLAVLGRLDSDLTSPEDVAGDAFERAVGAFQPDSADVGEGALMAQLLDDRRFPDIGAWGTFTKRAAGSGVLVRSVARQAAPCSGTLVSEDVDPEDPEDPDPVTRMETRVCSTTLSDEDVRAFLDPTTWPGCSPLYCELRDEGAMPGGKGHRYVEVLSVDCADPKVEKIVVCLVVTTQQKGDECYVLGYGMCPDKGAGNGKVVVDHGTIVIEKNGDEWCFHTIKYLRFAGVANGAVMSLMACALGYAAVAEDFLHCPHRAGPKPEPDGPLGDWDPYLGPGGPEPDSGSPDGGDPGWDA